MHSPAYTTKVLDREHVAVIQHVSKEALARRAPGVRGVKFDVSDTLGFVTNSMALKLSGYVLSDPDRRVRKTEKVSYNAAHPSWKHHLTASLPEGSFLRRWCHYFWDIPFDYANERVTETVEFDGKVMFPESTMTYPDDLGRPHYIIQSYSSQEREQFYGV